MKNEELGFKLDSLLKAMEKIAIPIPAIPAIPTIPPVLPSPDHDLLTKLDTKVDQIQTDVTTLKNQGNMYVTQDQHRELTKSVSDHETRLRLTEKSITQIMTWGAVGIIVLGVIETLILRYVK